MENRVFREVNRYSWSTLVTRILSGYDFSQFKFVASIKKHHFMSFFQQNLVKSRFLKILILPIFRQKMTFWVDFMNWNGQQSSPDSIFVIRVLRNKDTALKTHGFQLKKPNFQNIASTDITTNRPKKMMFLADFMGCNDQKSSRNGIFVTRNNLGSLYTSFSWVLELIGNLRRNYESVPVFALRGLRITSLHYWCTSVQSRSTSF